MTIKNLLPGQFNTARIEALIEKRTKENGIISHELRAKLEEKIPQNVAEKKANSELPAHGFAQLILVI